MLQTRHPCPKAWPGLEAQWSVGDCFPLPGWTQQTIFDMHIAREGIIGRQASNRSVATEMVCCELADAKPAIAALDSVAGAEPAEPRLSPVAPSDENPGKSLLGTEGMEIRGIRHTQRSPLSSPETGLKPRKLKRLRLFCFFGPFVGHHAARYRANLLSKFCDRCRSTREFARGKSYGAS